LVLLDMGRPERTMDDVRGMFDGFLAARQRAKAESVRWILVATSAEVPTALERRVLVEEGNKLSPEEHALCAACVLVIPNGFIRGVIAALFWMIPHVSPLVAAPTTDAAVETAVDRLRSIGIACPADRAARAAGWFRGER